MKHDLQMDHRTGELWFTQKIESRRYEGDEDEVGGRRIAKGLKVLGLRISIEKALTSDDLVVYLPLFMCFTSNLVLNLLD